MPINNSYNKSFSSLVMYNINGLLSQFHRTLLKLPISSSYRNHVSHFQLNRNTEIVELKYKTKYNHCGLLGH